MKSGLLLSVIKFIGISNREICVKIPLFIGFPASFPRFSPFAPSLPGVCGADGAARGTADSGLHCKPHPIPPHPARGNAVAYVAKLHYLCRHRAGFGPHREKTTKNNLQTMKLATTLLALLLCLQLPAKEKFPDGTPIPEWFRDNRIVDIETLGTRYLITDYGVTAGDSTQLQTERNQAVIDRAAAAGGGVVDVPEGTFLSGALFFKPGTHLHLLEGARLKGSDDISDFPIVQTRIEGQSLKYFSAFINADGVDGFTLSGKGTVDGNGLRYWRSFWLRRAVNPNCTNMDEMRPRLLYVSNSKDVQISGVRLVNSPFWTSHFYRCERVKLLDLHIYSPAAPVKAPSTDAVDIDVCKDFLIKGCYMSVNDDAVALKGGKGPWADTDPDNGGNYNIIIEDCIYGFCHGCLTCGSESIHDRNIIVRRCRIDKANRLLWLKMRPDTPQNYEYILVEDITGNANNFLYVHPWTQFFDLKDRKDVPMSYSSHVTMRNIDLECDTFFNVSTDDSQYRLSDFTFENLDIKARKNGACDTQAVERFKIKKVRVTE